MKITNLAGLPKTKVQMDGAKDAYRQTPVSKNDGSPTFAFRVFTVEPGGHTPYHAHAFEHLNFVIDGEGALVDADGREQPVRKGDFALVLPNEKHQYRNTGKAQPLVFLCAVPIAYE
jgi:quercetin dioxygenase-like cupin family protein